MHRRAARALAVALLLAATIGSHADATIPGPAGRIAFSSIPSFDFENERFQLYTVRPDGSGLRRLTDSPTHSIFPDWSPDGSTIAFERTEDSNAQPSDIYVIHPDGSGERRLTTFPGHDGDPAYSPDGAKIAFGSERGGNFDIWLMNADGTNQRRLVRTPLLEWFPQFSPDGQRIVFTSFRRDGRTALFTVPADGGPVSRLTPWRINGGHPDWSPDGSLIVFNTMDDVPGSSQIHVTRPDGSGHRAITSDPDTTYYNPTFSPTGDRITCERGRSSGDRFEIDLVVMRSDGSGLRGLNVPGVYALGPDWGPSTD